MKQQPIRIMIVDDHLMIRDGLKVFLSLYEDLEVVAEAADGQQAIDTCRDSQPHVILMDMIMPTVDGPAANTLAYRSSPSLPSANRIWSNRPSKPEPSATC